MVKELRGRTWQLGLAISGTDAVILLGTFSRKAVQQACLARGWRFENGPSSGADARRPAFG